MPQPQQPELRRSDYGATSDESAKIKAPVQEGTESPTETGPVPEDNLPGHHPAHEQDKPDAEAFVERVRTGAVTED